jgi:hypothetical protein
VSIYCATRALQNARRLQSVAPHIIPADEPGAGFASLVPIETLSNLHLMSDIELVNRPDLLAAARALRATNAALAGSFSPLFHGTVYFAQITFYSEASGAAIAVSLGDVETVIQFATLAAGPISGYASQYGKNHLEISPVVLKAGFAVTTGFYNDDSVQSWVNGLLHDNHLDPAASCIVIMNPPLMVNTDATNGVEGYHSKAESPYCFVNVVGQGFTVADFPQDGISDHYALVLSHELAEMTVDPDASSNPEVCDSCGPNCGRVWRAYFKSLPGSPVSTLIETTQAHPPPFAFDFFINAIVQPNHASDCPASEGACAYAPPGPTTGEPRILFYDRAAGEGDVYGLDASGKINFATANTGWRTSWDLRAAGAFLGNGQRQAVLYDRSAGQADVVGFDSNGQENLDTTNSGWRTSWASAVSGDFVGNGRSQILLYDAAAGEADVVGFDGAGATSLDTTTSGWRNTWGTIVAGHFLGNGKCQALLYDRDGGAGALIGFDAMGNVDLDPSFDGWRASWDVIVVGEFLGNHKDQVLLYDRNSGQSDIVGFDATGNINLDITHSGWRTTWNLIVAGKLVGNGRSQIVLYDRDAGHADVVGFDSSGQQDLDTANDGWLTGWDVIVSGALLQGHHDQILLYDRSAGQVDVVGFGSTGQSLLDTVNPGLRTTFDDVLVLN